MARRNLLRVIGKPVGALGGEGAALVAFVIGWVLITVALVCITRRGDVMWPFSAGVFLIRGALVSRANTSSTRKSDPHA